MFLEQALSVKNVALVAFGSGIQDLKCKRWGLKLNKLKAQFQRKQMEYSKVQRPPKCKQKSDPPQIGVQTTNIVLID
jgi:hypothetical protein